jgi:hypothetical protein
MAKWWGRVLYRRPLRILGDAWWECARVVVGLSSRWARAGCAGPPVREREGRLAAAAAAGRRGQRW